MVKDGRFENNFFITYFHSHFNVLLHLKDVHFLLNKRNK